MSKPRSSNAKDTKPSASPPEPTDAGQDSPHLDAREQLQAAEHVSPAAIVIHEVVREEGETELDRSVSTLLWSRLAAGLSMDFSLLGLALIRAHLPDAPWRPPIANFGYSIGFVIVILDGSNYSPRAR